MQVLADVGKYRAHVVPEQADGGFLKIFDFMGFEKSKMAFFRTLRVAIVAIAIAAYLAIPKSAPLPLNSSLEGSVCLVTGASRGIGRGMASSLLEVGCTVYITGRSAKTIKAACSDLNKGASSEGSGTCVALEANSADDKVSFACVL